MANFSDIFQVQIGEIIKKFPLAFVLNNNFSENVKKIYLGIYDRFCDPNCSTFS